MYKVKRLSVQNTTSGTEWAIIAYNNLLMVVFRVFCEVNVSIKFNVMISTCIVQYGNNTHIMSIHTFGMFQLYRINIVIIIYV